MGYCLPPIYSANTGILTTGHQQGNRRRQAFYAQQKKTHITWEKQEKMRPLIINTQQTWDMASNT